MPKPRLERGALAVRGTPLYWGARTYVMAIVNVAPDSFSGDGLAEETAAVEHGLAQWRAGADLLDVGGESTRPGYTQVDAPVEAARIVPVIRALRERLPDVPISVDTYKPQVAAAAHDAGADIVNSVLASIELLELAAEREMPIVAMHNQPGTRYDGNVVDAILEYFEAWMARAAQYGIARERILLDPGIGFGKTADQNVEVLRRLDRIASLGFPTLLGASRKSTIGKLTGREPQRRVYGTAATTALAIAAGFDMVRVHDVAAARDVIAVADAVVRDWRPDDWTA